MADSPLLARYANQMPENTGVASNLLEGATLKQAAELLFYGSGAEISVTIPISISAEATETIAGDVTIALAGVSVSSQAVELYPPDVFMFLNGVVVSATATEELPPASADVDLTNLIGVSSTAANENIASADIEITGFAVAADAEQFEQAEIFGNVAVTLGPVGITSTASHMLQAEGAVGVELAIHVSGTLASEFTQSILRAVLTSKVSHLRIRTKVSND